MYLKLCNFDTFTLPRLTTKMFHKLISTKQLIYVLRKTIILIVLHANEADCTCIDYLKHYAINFLVILG